MPLFIWSYAVLVLFLHRYITEGTEGGRCLQTIEITEHTSACEQDVQKCEMVARGPRGWKDLFQGSSRGT